MSLSALCILLAATGTLATLLAAALWVRAWRGKATGWASCCRRCGFRLQGLNPRSSACPECGLQLDAAATLRPVTRSNDPRRWRHAVAATTAALLMLWFAQPTQLFRAGRWLCSNLPNALLIDALEVMPSVAAAEITQRLQQDAWSDDQMARLAHAAAVIAAANPDDRPGPGARVLSAFAPAWRERPQLLADALRTALAGVQLVAGSPRACKPDGAFIVTTILPSTQGATWITRNELRLTIETVTVRETDGTMRPLASLRDAARESGREFDGAAFRAPAATGPFECEVRVRLRQPGGGFDAEATARFELRVLDPSMLQVTFAPDAQAAALLRAWLAGATTAVDAPGTGLLVSLPNDFAALQAQPTVIAGALRVTQGELSLDAGRLWIDDALPTISLFAAPMPAALDRSRPATLRFTPDLPFAMGVASSSCTALGDTVEVPIALPPPPAQPPPAAAIETAPAPASSAP